MTKYLIILILVSCGSNYETASPVIVTNTTFDSLSVGMDSLAQELSNINIEAGDFISYVERTESKIKKLEDEKKNLEEKVSDASIVYIEKGGGDDKTIAELNKQIRQYQNEIESLRSQLTKKRVEEYVAAKKENQTIEVPKPDYNSLVIELDKKVRGDGELPISYIDLYIVPFSKKAKKSLMRYEVSCDVAEINSYGAKQASYYNGQYFFNGIEPGKYIIKICYYYGGFAVIEKKDEYQIVKMQVSPPTQ